MVTVIHDPSGDFRPGSQFRMNEVADMHAWLYWPMGIRFRLHDGKTCRVIGKLMIRDDGFILDAHKTSGTYKWRDLRK